MSEQIKHDGQLAARNQFETWAKKHCCAAGGISFTILDDGMYADGSVETAWQAWQAASADLELTLFAENQKRLDVERQRGQFQQQRDRLLSALRLLLCDCEEAEYMTGREREAEARAVIEGTEQPHQQAERAAYDTQWWLASISRHGNPTLEDGAHSKREGANQAFYLINALGVAGNKVYAVAKVELFHPVADGSAVNHQAIAECNAASTTLAAHKAQEVER